MRRSAMFLFDLHSCVEFIEVIKKMNKIYHHGQVDTREVEDCSNTSADQQSSDVSDRADSEVSIETDVINAKKLTCNI
jgi:hypothetical protein